MQPLVQIHIYKPDGSYYVHGNDDSTYFPVTDSCERKAEVMGENSIHLMFALEDCIVIKAFSYVTYDAVNYFVKEDYEPQYKDGAFNYDLTFYAIENLLDKILIKKAGTITQQTKNLQRCNSLTEIQEKITENAAKFYSIGASVFANFQMPKYYLDESTGILYKIEDFPTNPLTDLPTGDYYYSSLGSMMNEEDQALLATSLAAQDDIIRIRCLEKWQEGNGTGPRVNVTGLRSLAVSCNFRAENYYGQYSFSKTVASERRERTIFPCDLYAVKLFEIETDYETGPTHYYHLNLMSYEDNHYAVIYDNRGGHTTWYHTDVSNIKINGSSVLDYRSDPSSAIGKPLQLEGMSLPIKTARYRDYWIGADGNVCDITLGLNLLNLGQYSRYIEETTFSLTSSVDNFYMLILQSMARGRFSGTIELDLQRICATSNGVINQGVPYDNTGQNIAMQFDGTTIKQALDTIAEELGVEWYIKNYILYVRKCTHDQTPIEFCDAMINTGERTERRRSGGLLSITPKDKESGIPAIIYPVGSERNIVSSFVHENSINQLIQYDNRLHLRQNYQYTVKDEEGHDVVLQTNSGCGIASTEITTHIEQQIEFNEIYPRCYYRVKAVITDHLTNGTDRYKIVVAAIKADGTLYTTAQMKSYGLFLTKNTADAIAGQTPTIIFENGLLNGFEFEVNFGTTSSAGTGYAAGDMQITIVTKNADENADTSESERDYDNLGITVNSTLLPQGDFIPQVGDEISIVGIYMPNYYVEMARQELAQAAYDRFVELTKSLPSFTCVADPKYMIGKDIYLGSKVRILAQIFNNGLLNTIYERFIYDWDNNRDYIKRLYDEINSISEGYRELYPIYIKEGSQYLRGLKLKYLHNSDYYKWSISQNNSPIYPKSLSCRYYIPRDGVYTLSFLMKGNINVLTCKEKVPYHYVFEIEVPIEGQSGYHYVNINGSNRLVIDPGEIVGYETVYAVYKPKNQIELSGGAQIPLKFVESKSRRLIIDKEDGSVYPGEVWSSGEYKAHYYEGTEEAYIILANNGYIDIDTIDNLDEYERQYEGDTNPGNRYLYVARAKDGIQYRDRFYVGKIKRIRKECDMIAYITRTNGQPVAQKMEILKCESGRYPSITFKFEGIDTRYYSGVFDMNFDWCRYVDNRNDDLELTIQDMMIVAGSEKAKFVPPQDALVYKETRVVALKHPLSHPEQVTFETASIKKLGYLEQQKIQMQQIKNQIKKK